MAPPIIILGMHRSGTSLFSQWLSLSGLNLGDDLYGASEFNPYGYYEDCDFIHLHKALLESHQSCVSGHELPLQIGEFSEAELEFAKSVLKKKGGNRVWGWKEPRTCLFLPLYRQLIPKAKYVIVVRNYESIIASLVNRERFKQSRLLGLFARFGAERILRNWYRWRFNDYYAKIVNYYFSCLVSHCHQVQKDSIVINLDELVTNSDVEKKRISGFLPDLDFVDFEKVYDGSVMSLSKGSSFINKKTRSSLEENFRALIELSKKNG